MYLIKNRGYVEMIKGNELEQLNGVKDKIEKTLKISDKELLRLNIETNKVLLDKNKDDYNKAVTEKTLRILEGYKGETYEGLEEEFKEQNILYAYKPLFKGTQKERYKKLVQLVGEEIEETLENLEQTYRGLEDKESNINGRLVGTLINVLKGNVKRVFQKILPKLIDDGKWASKRKEDLVKELNKEMKVIEDIIRSNN